MSVNHLSLVRVDEGSEINCLDEKFALRNKVKYKGICSRNEKIKVVPNCLIGQENLTKIMFEF